MNVKKIDFALEKLLNSNEFSESQSSKRLLEYLVKISQTDEMPKESTIAYEIFGKDSLNTSKSNTNVRVYVHNLRKKLDSYYMNEGKNDPIHFTIPKGHYKVHIVENTNNSIQSIQKRWWLVAILIILLTSLFINFYLLFKSSSNPNSESLTIQHGIWSNLFDNPKPVLLVFGDYYLFRDDFSIRGVRYIRDFQVNSYNDFIDKIENANNPYIATDHTFLGKFALWTLFNIEKLFYNGQKNIELKLASDLNWMDMNKYNVIFIGPFKTQRILNSIASNLNYSYRVHPNRLIYTEKDSTYSYRAAKVNETGYERDYTLVTKLPGPNNNIIYIFSSTHDIGHISTVQNLTDITKIKELGEPFQNPENLDYFLAIFEVQGFERTSFSPTLLHFKSIPQDYKIIQPNIE